MSAQGELPLAGAPAERFPRLSRTLRFPPRLDRCQNCGRLADVGPDSEGYDHTVDGVAVPVLERWREHDDQDQPEPIVIVLCTLCSSRIIEPHPRLYSQLEVWAPLPGAMGICIGCVHQDAERGLRCTHPSMRPTAPELFCAVMLTMPAPMRFHWSGRGAGGRRTGGWATHYTGPVTDCAGRAGVAP